MKYDMPLMIVHSGTKRTPTQRLRDEIECLKCHIENLERENAQLREDIAEAIGIGVVCRLCANEAGECPGPREMPLAGAHPPVLACPVDMRPAWAGLPEDADE